MMRIKLLGCAAIAASMLPNLAFADDPHDPSMRSAAARAHDHETIRQLNLQELAMVRSRDAQYAQGWRAARASGNSQAHDGAMADHARNLAQYRRDMAAWRRRMAACKPRTDGRCANQDAL